MLEMAAADRAVNVRRCDDHLRPGTARHRTPRCSDRNDDGRFVLLAQSGRIVEPIVHCTRTLASSMTISASALPAQATQFALGDGPAARMGAVRPRSRLS